MTDDRDVSEANYSGTVIKALDVLDCLAQHRRPMTTQEIARVCGMSRPTTYRLLATLLSRGFVRSDSDYNYSLGTKFLSLGKIVLDSIDLQELARPYLHELCQLSNETANLAILDGTELLYIGKEESVQNSLSPVFVQMRSTVGTRVMLHSTSMGKAILAHLTADQVQAILERTTPLKAYTAQTITDLTVLKREMELIRGQGYALDDREVDDGTRCVAAPVFDSSGQVIAAMSIAGPAYRLTIEQLTQLAAQVMRVAVALSRQLGYIASR
ncbi:MAG: IclR family transcriptional regulator [Anaerolineae bacterium]|nr:IclR family transcriptional regulator [Anaerolineae bacterium]